MHLLPSPVYGTQSLDVLGTCPFCLTSDRSYLLAICPVAPLSSYCGGGTTDNVMDSFPTVKEIAQGLLGAVGLYIFMWSLFVVAVAVGH